MLEISNRRSEMDCFSVTVGAEPLGGGGVGYIGSGNIDYQEHRDRCSGRFLIDAAV